MSSAGRVPAWVIEKQRREIERVKEQERRAKVRKQIEEACTAIQYELTVIAKSGNAAFASEEITAIADVLKKTESIEESEVDDILRQVSQSQAIIQQLNTIAQSRRKEMKMELDFNKSLIDGLLIELKSISIELVWQENQTDIERLVSSIEDLTSNLKRQSLSQIEDVLTITREKAEIIRSKDIKQTVNEELRRHIVASLISSMRELGFVVGKPKLIHEKGRVVVIGNLSSGRTVRFEVNDGGEMEFDMDGFSDRKCADHLDEVLAELETKFGVETGPIQHNWKNPDRISKGSKGFPTGGNTRSIGGGKE